MRIKKFMSVLLIVALMFSFCSFFVSAAEENGFYSRNMVHKAYIMQNVDNVLTAFDYTDHLTVSNGTYASKNCTVYTLSGGSEDGIKYVSSYQIKELNASHEYHLKFSASSNIIGDSNICYVSLIFYNGDEVLKTQQLGGCVFSNDQWQEVEFDFVPDASGLGGYSTRLEFLFMSYSNYDSVIYRLSDFIELEDKDNNASWFQKIINAIKELPSNFVNGIKSFFDNLGNKISELGDNIQSFFVDLGENIGEFFTMLKNYLLYFQHPVTTNSDGVLVDGSGNPVYTNPFDSVMNSVKNTVDGWLSDIDDFISDIDESRLNVKTYLETGSGVINDVLGASPILSAAVIFAAAFLVIRKVVGR